ncbi:amino acid/polyamine transporter I [Aspergillus pseudonomiae]|uniref:Amino acid/polyamine transporter I n=1 Tax=Aspergillus pseudonomiae TaxID=1506151 RepID=A0A5N7DRL9_9EURO|nr:amino acid/polyamine transporter I [Aspergillus pseudonomiae]KAB8266160.1 amino acid/polyamine transporter I [Aspergillus pseudonomiae]KAE8409026.1 amino acid/polyamine transporter I [Aspergillus pseudonomiae]
MGTNAPRHLGLVSTALLPANRMIGAAIFSVPSSIIVSVGSAGAALSLWVLGLTLSLCGFYIWLELGCLMPSSGGEKVYLEAAYPRPYRLAGTLFAFYILFAFGGLASIVVADNFLLAVDCTASDLQKRALAIAVLFVVAAILSVSQKWGLRIMNLLALVKMAILLLIICTAFAITVGVIPSKGPTDRGTNFRQPFAGSSSNIYDYTVSLFKVLGSFQGWNNSSLILGEVSNPQRTLKMAGVFGVGSVGVLYLLVNVSYLIIATPDDMRQTGLQLVARILGSVFGSATTRVTGAMVALSSLGSIMSVAFTVCRVIRELAMDEVIPASSMLSTTTRSGNPTPATFVYLFGTSAAAMALIPFGDAYDFLIDASQYQAAMINFAVVVGVFIIRQRVPAAEYPFRVWTSIAYVFLAVQVYLLVSPFWSPQGQGDTSLPYWLAPMVAIAGFGCGASYWWWARDKTVTRDRPSRTLLDRTQAYGSVPGG